MVQGAIANANEVSAIGRLEYSSGSSCSGTLVAPDVVLTAAHCVSRYVTGEDEENSPETLVFRPGVGLSGPVYAVTKSAVHPFYGGRMPYGWRLRFDFAVVQLDEPVSSDIATPLPISEEAELGEELFLVSWRYPDGPRPRQRKCEVILGLRGLVTLGCKVVGGESGAPLLRKGEDGLSIVAVISSRFKLLEQPVGQASNIARRLEPLIAALEKPSGS